MGKYSILRQYLVLNNRIVFIEKIQYFWLNYTKNCKFKLNFNTVFGLIMRKIIKNPGSAISPKYRTLGCLDYLKKVRFFKRETFANSILIKGVRPNGAIKNACYAI